MQHPTGNPELAGLAALVGTWTTEATHQAFPPTTVVHGHSTFEWLEGERFLIQRSANDHPDFPDALAVFGVTDEQLSMHYFDSRGVYRIYAVAMTERAWSFSRDVPGFAQRFTGTFSDDGNTIAGVVQLCTDGSTWEDDLTITYRRVS